MNQARSMFEAAEAELKRAHNPADGLISWISPGSRPPAPQLVPPVELPFTFPVSVSIH